ncbi:phage protein [Streptococcus pneumoniae]|nr:hypothetical protein [Streptococcus pneumoniae]VNX33728.1 phage protein [Streptococcus pneumoniae]VTE59378.1 phage protein [Streptococcus pneumoniae]
MKRLAIETITKPMKLRGISKGIAELDGQGLEIDLDNLEIDFGGESFDLARIPGTKGGYRYFFLCPDCGRRCRLLYKRYLYFSCGTCLDIHKSTLNRSKTDCQYYWELALKEARKVEPGWSPIRTTISLLKGGRDMTPEQVKETLEGVKWINKEISLALLLCFTKFHITK